MRTIQSRNGALIKIIERDGKEYVYLTGLAQSLGFAQFHPQTSRLSQIARAHGLKVELVNRKFVMELTSAKKLLESWAAWRRSKKSGKTPDLAEDTLRRLGQGTAEIPLFVMEPAREPEPVIEVKDTDEEIFEWAVAIAKKTGISPARALQLAEGLMIKCAN